MEVTHELKALKSRLSRLQEVFNSLPAQPPGPEEWPFWLEKFNALSGQFSGLERELFSSANLLKEFLLEPAQIPSNTSIPIDSSKKGSEVIVPNILLRSKLAPEVIEKVKVVKMTDSNSDSDSRVKLFSNTIRALQDKFSVIQDELQRSAAEQTSILIANDLRIASASGTSTPKKSGTSQDDLDALLENSVQWLYTGHQ